MTRTAVTPCLEARARRRGREETDRSTRTASTSLVVSCSASDTEPIEFPEGGFDWPDNTTIKYPERGNPEIVITDHIRGSTVRSSITSRPGGSLCQRSQGRPGPGRLRDSAAAALGAIKRPGKPRRPFFLDGLLAPLSPLPCPPQRQKPAECGDRRHAELTPARQLTPVSPACREVLTNT
jgi:hypothetical protein